MYTTRLRVVITPKGKRMSSHYVAHLKLILYCMPTTLKKCKKKENGPRLFGLFSRPWTLL